MRQFVTQTVEVRSITFAAPTLSLRRMPRGRPGTLLDSDQRSRFHPPNDRDLESAGLDQCSERNEESSAHPGTRRVLVLSSDQTLTRTLRRFHSDRASSTRDFCGSVAAFWTHPTTLCFCRFVEKKPILESIHSWKITLRRMNACPLLPEGINE